MSQAMVSKSKCAKPADANFLDQVDLPALELPNTITFLTDGGFFAGDCMSLSVIEISHGLLGPVSAAVLCGWVQRFEPLRYHNPENIIPKS